MELTAMGKAAKAAALRLNTLGTQAKDRVLLAMASADGPYGGDFGRQQPWIWRQPGKTVFPP